MVDEPRRSELRERLLWVRKFIEYARYELQPGEEHIGDQFPRQVSADKAMREIDAVLGEIEKLDGEAAALSPSRPSVHPNVDILLQESTTHRKIGDKRQSERDFEAAKARYVLADAMKAGADALQAQVKGEAAALANELTQANAMLDGIRAALDGDTLSDFLLSFPLVRAASDMRNQRDDAIALRDRAEAAALDAPELTKADARRVAELKGEAFALDASPRDTLIDWLIDRREGRPIPTPDTDGAIFERSVISKEINAIIEYANQLLGRAGSVPCAASLHPTDSQRVDAIGRLVSAYRNDETTLNAAQTLGSISDIFNTDWKPAASLLTDTTTEKNDAR